MKNKVHITRLIFLTFFFCAFCFGQNNSAPKEFLSVKESDIKLDTSLGRERVGIDEEIDLTVLIQNNFSKMIMLPYDRYDAFGGYSVEIKDTKGNLIKLAEDSAASKIGIGSRTALELMPGEKFKSNKLPISKFYHLPIGKYSITVSLIVANSVKRQKIIIKSKPKILRIVD